MNEKNAGLLHVGRTWEFRIMYYDFWILFSSEPRRIFLTYALLEI
jgi:hypothetical protein